MQLVYCCSVWPADADKRSYAGYFEQLLRLVRRGGVIAVDNILWCAQASIVICSPYLRAESSAKVQGKMRYNMLVLIAGYGNHLRWHAVIYSRCSLPRARDILRVAGLAVLLFRAFYASKLQSV